MSAVAVLLGVFPTSYQRDLNRLYPYELKVENVFPVFHILSWLRVSEAGQINRHINIISGPETKSVK